MEGEETSNIPMYIAPPNTTPVVRDLSSVVPMLANSEDIISVFEHDLRGEVWINDPQLGGQWIQKGKPIMNEEGIKNICSLIHPFVNKISRTTTLSDEEIGKHIFNALGDVRVHLYSHYDSYALDITNIEIVILKFKPIVFTCWKSSKNTEIGKLLLGGVTERYIQAPQGVKSGGLFGGKLAPGII